MDPKKWIVDGKFKELSKDERKDLSIEELGEYTSAKNKNDLSESLAAFKTTIMELLPKEGEVATSDDIRNISEKVANGLREIEEKTGNDIEALDVDVKEKLSQINDLLIKQGIQIKNLGDNSGAKMEKRPSTMGDPVKTLIKTFVDSEQYKEFANNGYKGKTSSFGLTKSGKLIDIESAERKGLAEKTVSVAADHTGNIFITDERLNIRDFPLRQGHVRDLMLVDSTDGTQITAPEVYDYTDAINGGMDMLAENAEAQDIGFKTRENTWTINRIAAALPLSKRYLKTNGLSWVASYLGQRLPNFVRNKEDFQILFGDGSGDNVDGLTKDAQQFNLDRATYVATDFTSIATYESGNQTLITFTAAHGMRNGDTLTIANATAGAAATAYNKAHPSVIVKDEVTVIINVGFVADPNVNANWTGSSASAWKESIDGAQIYDALVVAANELRTAEYMATGIVINPADFDKMGLIKANDLQYVGVARDAFGRVTINGLPIAQTTAIPAGQFLVGDFQMAVALSEYTPLSIRAIEDTTDAKKNQVTWIIEEEFILPKYNPFWFIYGFFSAAITQLETP